MSLGSLFKEREYWKGFTKWTAGGHPPYLDRQCLFNQILYGRSNGALNSPRNFDQGIASLGTTRVLGNLSVKEATWKMGGKHVVNVHATLRSSNSFKIKPSNHPRPHRIISSASMEKERT
jgi:hypothetical protein